MGRRGHVRQENLPRWLRNNGAQGYQANTHSPEALLFIIVHSNQTKTPSQNLLSEADFSVQTSWSRKGGKSKDLSESFVS